MKKAFFLFMLLALGACSKKSAPTPIPDAAVVYHFTSNSAAAYQIRYAGSDGNAVTATFTGTTWSKTITANRASGFRNAVFFINLTTRGTITTGSADISVNNKITSQVPFTFNSGDGSTDLTFYAFVFK